MIWILALIFASSNAWGDAYRFSEQNIGLRSRRQNVRMENDNLPFIAKQITPKSGESPLHVPFVSDRLEIDESLERASGFCSLMNQRRSLRFYSTDSFPVELVEKCVQTAGTAPSGAHQQPWHFAIIESKEVKRKIRSLVEREEQINYDQRMKKTWVADVVPLLKETPLYDDKGAILKPYLEDAPYLVVLFEQVYGYDNLTGDKIDHYYVRQSVGIAAGLFLAALTNAGLFSLPSTPLNAGDAIRKLLNRPDNERVNLLLPIGYPAPDATVPYRSEDTVPLRKAMSEIMSKH
mmetsp:Transcript_2195/g.3459  ORF Transcript_2195/g.3459 Transcript_2195/m.3459 type:complete len:292 (+) Transcript_2195:56-931(+)|eukprot:CAMPEP_0174971372 /NCGR_PEP_ID=MMETSP0004_2-20121128/9953_1 /TAXON_ID=420556 /ORGANISM="Ochromonas sp., Strain CCMP1393" /LENGTH=291 /DNA_ID=CAMNT_0016221309 /DNA_START=53 /DNA_END=928 /DNA_ORIENTATION=-